MQRLDLLAGYVGRGVLGQKLLQKPVALGGGAVLIVEGFKQPVLEFRNFRGALIVASVIPLGVSGGLLALLVTGNTLSFTANIGFVALMGIEVKNSILLVDFTNQLRAEGVPAGKVYGGKPVYAAPQILNQWTITDGCPFNCSTYFPEPIQYSMGMCPRTEDLLNRAVNISVGPFYEEEDLDDLIVGIQKVARHLL